MITTEERIQILLLVLRFESEQGVITVSTMITPWPEHLIFG